MNVERALLRLLTCIGATIGMYPSIGTAQLPGSRVPGGCDVPVAARTSEVGCYLTATETLSNLPSDGLFWHLYEYRTRAAAESAKPQSFGTVAESLGAGQGAVVPMGPPMVLTGMGTEMRRSVVLVLHDTSQPWMTITTDWKPDAPCSL